MPKKIDLMGDDDDLTRKANESAAEELKGADPDGKVKVSLKDEEPDDDDEPKGENAEDREDRLEKRRQRGRQREKERKDAESRAVAAEAEAKVYREQVADGARATREMLELVRKQQPKELDDLEKQEADLLKERDSLVDEWNSVFRAHPNGVPQELVDKYDRRNLDLSRRLAKLDGAMGARAAMPKSDPASQQAQQTTLLIAARHPDVQANPQALAFAQNYYRALVSEGKPNIESGRGMPTVDEAMEEARKRFRMPGKNQVSDSLKRRFIAGPRGAQSADDDDEEVVLDKDSQAMALAMYAHDKKASDEQKYRRFVRLQKEK